MFQKLAIMHLRIFFVDKIFKSLNKFVILTEPVGFILTFIMQKNKTHVRIRILMRKFIINPKHDGSINE